ncbi:MAG: hypothetical protein LUD00_13425, partial [Prevotellaceae bacterium]|nr:hypothetical protein [Prevotellaceae bacterium]
TRARGLGILTFDKIKKIVTCAYFEQNVFCLLKTVFLLSKTEETFFFVFKFFVMGLLTQLSICVV